MLYAGMGCVRLLWLVGRFFVTFNAYVCFDPGDSDLLTLFANVFSSSIVFMTVSDFIS